ncbi:MAG: sulfonate transport system permease protein [Abditibacteriota bacterium]|nr:sulfonate transport system permease protein [Abditibacteriota bacterium]
MGTATRPITAGQANTESGTTKKVIAEKAAARRAFWSDVAIRAAFVAFLVLLWHTAHYVLVTRTQSWSGALFPAPSQVGRWLWDGFGLSYFTGNYDKVPGHELPQSFLEAIMQKDYVRSIGASIYRLVWGYAIAVVIGFPLGLLVARFSLAEKTIGWLSLSLQSLPSICWIPLALLWFGRFGAAPILFVTVMGALFATVVSVADGIRNVPPLLARAGRTLGADGVRLYSSVLLPAALPGIVTGLKIGWSFAWRSLMAAELIVNAGGLGFLLQRDREFGDAEGVLATILVIIVIGLGVQALVFAPTERRLQNLWGLSGVRS